MIFNCLNCGVSVSTKVDNCSHCRHTNHEALQFLTGKIKKEEKNLWQERLKGSILSLVTK